MVEGNTLGEERREAVERERGVGRRREGVEEEAVRERMNYNIHSYNHQPYSSCCLVGSCIGSQNPPHSGNCDESSSSGLYELLVMVN